LRAENDPPVKPEDDVGVVEAKRAYGIAGTAIP
jgi:hypothetical protein